MHSVFLGGAHDRDILKRTDEELLEVARRSQAQALASIGGGRLPQGFGQIVRYPAGIPQFTAGHRDRVERFRATLAEALPGVHVAGSFFDGISVGDAAESGLAVAQAALAGAGRR